MSLRLFFALVEVTGLEPATAWSQTRNATNCATPRFAGAFLKSAAKVRIFCDPCKFFRNYFRKNFELLNNSLFHKDFLECYHRAIHLLLGMCSHQGVTNERVLRSTCGWNNGVDKYTSLKG